MSSRPVRATELLFWKQEQTNSKQGASDSQHCQEETKALNCAANGSFELLIFLSSLRYYSVAASHTQLHRWNSLSVVWLGICLKRSVNQGALNLQYTKVMGVHHHAQFLKTSDFNKGIYSAISSSCPLSPFQELSILLGLPASELPIPVCLLCKKGEAQRLDPSPPADLQGGFNPE